LHKKNKNMFTPEQEEMCRKLENSKMFEKMLKSHKGNIIGLHKWVLSDQCKNQFEDAHIYNCFISDFIHWSKNGYIIYE